MKLSAIVLRLRMKNIEPFGQFIGGAAEIEMAMENTLKREMAFVIPLAEDATENDDDNGLQQDITERFGVIAALRNDLADRDKTSIIAYDKVDDVRARLFKALLGWQMTQGAGNTENLIEYRGARIIDVNDGYLWYQYEFESVKRVRNLYDNRTNDSGDGVELEGNDSILGDVQGLSGLASFETLFTQYVLEPTPKAKEALEAGMKDLPVDTSLIDMQNFIDLSLDKGDYDKLNFGTGFDFGKGG